MMNENLGENEHIIKKVEGAGVIKEVDMEKESPHTIEFGDNTNKELLETKETKEEDLIVRLNEVIETFQDIRAKYSKENTSNISENDKMMLEEDRESDNKTVEAFIEDLESLKMDLTSEREKGRIDFFKEEINNFLETNKGS